MALTPRRSATPGLIEVNSRPGDLGRAPVSGGRLLFVIDDALAESVDAERDQRFVADNTEDMRAMGRQYDRHAGFQRDPRLFSVEPRLAPPGKHRQRLDIGMRMDPRRIAGR